MRPPASGPTTGAFGPKALLTRLVVRSGGVFERCTDAAANRSLGANVFTSVRFQCVRERWNRCAISNASQTRNNCGAYIAARFLLQKLGEPESPHDFRRGHFSTAACRSFGLALSATGSERNQGSDASFGFLDGESMRQNGSYRMRIYFWERGFLDLDGRMIDPEHPAIRLTPLKSVRLKPSSATTGNINLSTPEVSVRMKVMYGPYAGTRPSCSLLD